MIPQKLYIPTSSLNFNNILSSESISPASFYAKRGFGYKRFEKVEPNNLDNRIILYQRYPRFEIVDKEIENFPLIIEIDSQTVNEDVIQEYGDVFYSDQTIYLNPFTTFFIFRNFDERMATMSKAEPSIETKMVVLYQKNFVLEPQEFKGCVFDKISIDDSHKDNSRHISYDRKLNKLKGLLYSYLLAANRSISKDSVILKKNVKQLRNTLSAVVTSPDGKATYSQQTQLKGLYNLINDMLAQAYISPIIKQKSDIYGCDFIHLLKSENLYETWIRQNYLNKFQIAPFYPSSKDKDKEFIIYLQNVEKTIESITYQNKSNIDVSCLPELQFNRIKNISGQKEFLIKLFNEFLEEAYTSEEFVQSRYEFAKAGGAIFKEELRDTWNGSSWQNYINALLKNLNEYTAFDIKTVNNHTLESFAAFCQKGEYDIDKLEDYLITNEISDFRIAFGLWGITFGFASIPKTLTNDLFLSDDRNYITAVYKHIFKELHNIELNGRIDSYDNEMQADLSETLPKSVEISTLIENEVESSLKSQDIIGKLNECKLNLSQLESILEMYERNRFVIDEKFFTDLKKIKGVGEATVKKIVKALNDDKKEEKRNNYQDPLLLDLKPSLDTEFYKDANAWSYIIDILPSDKKIRKQVKEDLDWFQVNYSDYYEDKKKGTSKGCYSEKQKDNNSTIEQYRKFLENKQTSNQTWLKEIYKEVNINEVIKKLQSFYCLR